MKPASAVAIRYSEANVPTEYGEAHLVVYREGGTTHEHCAIIFGDVHGKANVPVRVHSECITGEVFHSLKCDCREQLDYGLRYVASTGGLVIYLRQEGRGIGLGNKIKAYALQEQGADTVDANRRLGFADDLRRYEVAAQILRDLGVKSIALLTNNPDKVQALKSDGVDVTARIAVEIPHNAHNHEYLVTKRQRMGHLLSEPAPNEPAPVVPIRKHSRKSR